MEHTQRAVLRQQTLTSTVQSAAAAKGQSATFRDSQRSRVYHWENQYVALYDKSRVPFEKIQSVVDYVWASEGFQYPPKIELMPKQAHNKEGDATRLTIRFHNYGATTWCILHELAHSLTSTDEGISNYHGADFMGVYMTLLAKYLNIPISYLQYTAQLAKVKYDSYAIPVIAD